MFFIKIIEFLKEYPIEGVLDETSSEEKLTFYFFPPDMTRMVRDCQGDYRSISQVDAIYLQESEFSGICSSIQIRASDAQSGVVNFELNRENIKQIFFPDGFFWNRGESPTYMNAEREDKKGGDDMIYKNFFTQALEEYGALHDATLEKYIEGFYEKNFIINETRESLARLPSLYDKIDVAKSDNFIIQAFQEGDEWLSNITTQDGQKRVIKNTDIDMFISDIEGDVNNGYQLKDIVRFFCQFSVLSAVFIISFLSSSVIQNKILKNEQALKMAVKKIKTEKLTRQKNLDDFTGYESMQEKIFVEKMMASWRKWIWQSHQYEKIHFRDILEHEGMTKESYINYQQTLFDVPMHDLAKIISRYMSVYTKGRSRLYGLPKVEIKTYIITNRKNKNAIKGMQEDRGSQEKTIIINPVPFSLKNMSKKNTYDMMQTFTHEFFHMYQKDQESHAHDALADTLGEGETERRAVFTLAKMGDNYLQKNIQSGYAAYMVISSVFYLINPEKYDDWYRGDISGEKFIDKDFLQKCFFPEMSDEKTKEVIGFLQDADNISSRKFLQLIQDQKIEGDSLESFLSQLPLGTDFGEVPQGVKNLLLSHFALSQIPEIKYSFFELEKMVQFMRSQKNSSQKKEKMSGGGCLEKKQENIDVLTQYLQELIKRGESEKAKKIYDSLFGGGEKSDDMSLDDGVLSKLFPKEMQSEESLYDVKKRRRERYKNQKWTGVMQTNKTEMQVLKSAEKRVQKFSEKFGIFQWAISHLYQLKKYNNDTPEVLDAIIAASPQLQRHKGFKEKIVDTLQAAVFFNNEKNIKELKREISKNIKKYARENHFDKASKLQAMKTQLDYSWQTALSSMINNKHLLPKYMSKIESFDWFDNISLLEKYDVLGVDFMYEKMREIFIQLMSADFIAHSSLRAYELYYTKTKNAILSMGLNAEGRKYMEQRNKTFKNELNIPDIKTGELIDIFAKYILEKQKKSQLIYNNKIMNDEDFSCLIEPYIGSKYSYGVKKEYLEYMLSQSNKADIFLIDNTPHAYYLNHIIKAVFSSLHYNLGSDRIEKKLSSNDEQFKEYLEFVNADFYTYIDSKYNDLRLKNSHEYKQIIRKIFSLLNERLKNQDFYKNPGIAKIYFLILQKMTAEGVSYEDVISFSDDKSSKNVLRFLGDHVPYLNSVTGGSIYLLNDQGGKKISSYNRNNYNDHHFYFSIKDQAKCFTQQSQQSVVVSISEIIKREGNTEKRAQYADNSHQYFQKLLLLADALRFREGIKESARNPYELKRIEKFKYDASIVSEAYSKEYILLAGATVGKLERSISEAYSLQEGGSHRYLYLQNIIKRASLYFHEKKTGRMQKIFTEAFPFDAKYFETLVDGYQKVIKSLSGNDSVKTQLYELSQSIIKKMESPFSNKEEKIFYFSLLITHVSYERDLVELKRLYGYIPAYINNENNKQVLKILLESGKTEAGDIIMKNIDGFLSSLNYKAYNTLLNHLIDKNSSRDLKIEANDFFQDMTHEKWNQHIISCQTILKEAQNLESKIGLYYDEGDDVMTKEEAELFDTTKQQLHQNFLFILYAKRSINTYKGLKKEITWFTKEKEKEIDNLIILCQKEYRNISSADRRDGYKEKKEVRYPLDSHPLFFSSSSREELIRDIPFLFSLSMTEKNEKNNRNDMFLESQKTEKMINAFLTHMEKNKQFIDRRKQAKIFLKIFSLMTGQLPSRDIEFKIKEAFFANKHLLGYMSANDIRPILWDYYHRRFVQYIEEPLREIYEKEQEFEFQSAIEDEERVKSADVIKNLDLKNAYDFFLQKDSLHSVYRWLKQKFTTAPVFYDIPRRIMKKQSDGTFTNNIKYGKKIDTVE